MAKEKDLTKTIVHRFYQRPKQWPYKANWTVVPYTLVITVILVLLFSNLVGCNDLIPTQEF